jgi:hypothetical protein
LRIRDVLSRIPDPDPTIAPSWIRIPDPGGKKAPDPGSGARIRGVKKPQIRIRNTALAEKKCFLRKKFGFLLKNYVFLKKC